MKVTFYYKFIFSLFYDLYIKCLFFTGTVLPSTATLIQVTNVLTPYIMRISELKGYKEKLHLISKKLSMKRGILFDSNTKLTKPKLGDVRFLNYTIELVKIDNE